MRSVSTSVFTILALALAVGLAVAVSPYASASPDGLEKVAAEEGFLQEGTLHSLQDDSPIPDYAFPGIGNERVATGVAGFLGTLLVFGTAFALGALFRRRRGSSPPGAPAGA
jgi:hypothetical protein